jgi:hypothetical protein
MKQMAASQQNKGQKEVKTNAKKEANLQIASFWWQFIYFHTVPNKQRLIVNSIYDITKVRLPFVDMLRKIVWAHKNDVMEKRNCKINQVIILYALL